MFFKKSSKLKAESSKVKEESPEDRGQRSEVRGQGSEIRTTDAVIEDRMMRYGRNPACPKCNAHPTICTLRRGNYAAFRCRECGHRFEKTS